MGSVYSVAIQLEFAFGYSIRVAADRAANFAVCCR